MSTLLSWRIGPETPYCTGELVHILLILVHFSLMSAPIWQWSNLCWHIKILPRLSMLHSQPITRYPADNFRHLISFDPLVVTHPYTLHGSTIGMEWWCFECYAPAKMVVLLVDNGVGRKLSLWTIEAPDGEMGWKQDENYQYSKWSKLDPEISFAVRVATGNGL